MSLHPHRRTVKVGTMLGQPIADVDLVSIDRDERATAVRRHQDVTQELAVENPEILEDLWQHDGAAFFKAAPPNPAPAEPEAA